jgi:hypothetical protein
LRCFVGATVGGGTQRERRFLKNVARTRSFFERRALTSGAARRLQRGEIGVAGKARLAVASGRRSFSNEKRLDSTVLNRKIASD